MQIPEISSALDAAADLGVRGQGGNHYAVVCRCLIDDAHDARPADNTHVGAHAVCRTLVERDEVVRLVDAVAYHAGWDDAAAVKSRLKGAFRDARVLCRVKKTLAEQCNLLLKIYVALCETLVHLGQGEELVDGRRGFIYLARHNIGRREPHAALIPVELEEEHHGYYLKHDEDEPVMIFLQEIG